jgi:deferrochelatase/peroxidase EfeB
MIERTVIQRVAREAPAPAPFLHPATDPSFPDVLNRTVPPPEPQLNVANIQGNIIAGFNKDSQMLLCLRIGDAKKFKAWLKSQIPFIATAAQVLAFNKAFKELRFLQGVESNTLKSTWVNFAFSHAGLGKLKPDLSQDDFADPAFKDGLAKRSLAGILGDPIQARTPDGKLLEGHPDNWVIGGRKNEPVHVLILIAADDRCDMLSEVERIETSLSSLRTADGHRADSGAEIVFAEEGANLPPPLSGHEHFGFLDGISNPGIRGRISEAANNVLTPRQQPDKRDQPPTFDSAGKRTDTGKAAQGKPGQDVLWPGEFVFGYQQQDPQENEDWDGPNPIPKTTPALIDPKSKDRRTTMHGLGPEWARDGSYLVFRRLRQDVFAFHTFLHDQAKANGVPATVHSGAPQQIGASLVGRWPSGAPTERARAEKIPPTAFDPDQPDDDRAMADDDCANNNFEYHDAEQPITPVSPSTDPLACSDKNPAHKVDPSGTPAQFLPSPGDRDGKVLPLSGHVRKAYPRDDVNDPHKANDLPNESATQTHRIIRRGIPFGPVSPSTPDAPVRDDVVRGLHFLAYQTSIERQFEFIIQNWINNPNFRQPGAGHDPIIGQNDEKNAKRQRTFTIAFQDAGGKRQQKSVTVTTEWVIPTGGEYFFSPSIHALKHVLT